MAGLNTEKKDRIIEVLDASNCKRSGFTLKYDDERNPVAIITYSSRREYLFIIDSTDYDSFTTRESPGINSDEAETFQRSSFEVCTSAIREWVERIIEREKDWILDEFGGVADRNPSLG